MNNFIVGSIIEFKCYRRHYAYETMPPDGIFIVSKLEINKGNYYEIVISYYSPKTNFNDCFVIPLSEAKTLNEDKKLHTTMYLMKIL